MKVVHISTSTIGGAGVVANRIAALQRKNGLEVHVISLEKARREFPVKVFQRSFTKRMVAKLITVISLITTNKKWTQLTPISISARVLFQISQIKPDVVHIHNWFNILSLSDIKTIIQTYPTIFHIHDARLMTGGCHFTLDCDSYLEGCIKCPATKTMRPFVRKSFLNSEIIFQSSRPYALIFPSRWLERKFQSSSIYVNATVKTNSLAPIDFELISHVKVQSQDGVVCVISDLSAKVKGFDLFLRSVEILRSQGFTTVINVVGGNASSAQLAKMNELRVNFLGRLASSETLKVIAQSSLMVVPSYSENSPTVILEAQLLRTCVLVTAIEGCLELVEDTHTGYVCKPTPESIAAGIDSFFRRSNTEKVRNQAFERVSNNLAGIYKLFHVTYIEIIKEFNSYK